MPDTSPVTKYPATSEDIVGFYAWTLRDNMRIEDGACALAQTTATREYKALVKDYGFDIPANAIITKVEVGIKGAYSGSYSGHPAVYFSIGTFGFICTADIPSNVCSGTAWLWYDITNWGYTGWTPADFNVPNFITHVVTNNQYPYNILHNVDSVAIRVTFTLPSAVEPQMDGLVFVE